MPFAMDVGASDPWTVASFTTMSTVGSCSWIAFWMSYRVSPPEGRDDADPLRKRRRLLFLLVVEPATLFEFASQSLDGSRLVAVADDDHFHGLRSIFPPSTQ